MSHELGMKVTAEGVETSKQLQTLREASCDFAQGYLLTKPTSAESLMLACRSVTTGHDA
ncbi:EAL domain-containing protein [Burkholderia gladioli]|nr:EAL domain-containing protein [Burkholderia gladioli]